MAFAAFTRTLPTPTATLSGFVCLLNEAWWTQANANAMDGTTFINGGGSIRCYTDSSKTTQLPVEVVEFVTGGTPSAQVWVRVPNYTGASTTIYIESDAVATTQPAVTDPFGRNAVWQDFEYMFHLESTGLLVDSTGNYSLTENGTVVSVAAVVGEGTNSSNSVSNYLTVNGYAGPTGAQARTHKAYVRYDGDLGGHLDYGLAGVDGQEIKGRILNSRLYTYVGATYARTATSGYADGNWHSFTQVFDGTSTFPACYKNFVNGVDVGTTNNGSVTVNTVADGNIVFQNQSPLRAAVGQDEQSLRLFAISEDLDATEYSNQSSPSTFGTSSGWTTGGGGTPVNPDDISQLNTISNVDLVQSNVLFVDDLSQSQSVTNANLIQAHSLQVDDIESANTISNVTLVVAGGLSVNPIANSQSLGNIELTQAHILSVQDITNLQEIESASLIVNYGLSVDDISQLQLASNVEVLPTNGLIVQSLEQVSDITDPSLTQSHILIVDPISQLQFIGNVNLNEEDQTIGTVTAAFKENPVSVKYKLLNITVQFKE